MIASDGRLTHPWNYGTFPRVLGRDAFVIVNGTPVADGGKFTAARPGRVLRHHLR